MPEINLGFNLFQGYWPITGDYDIVPAADPLLPITLKTIGVKHLSAIQTLIHISINFAKLSFYHFDI
jgi:hypothetical protein